LERLVNALYAAREQVAALKEQVDKLCAAPSTYGVFLSSNEDGTINVLLQSRKAKVNLHPAITSADLRPGQEVILNERLNVVETAGYEIQGDPDRRAARRRRGRSAKIRAFAVGRPRPP
jgi:proteasome-associated ATPase